MLSGVVPPIIAILSTHILDLTDSTIVTALVTVYIAVHAALFFAAWRLRRVVEATAPAGTVTLPPSTSPGAAPEERVARQVPIREYDVKAVDEFLTKRLVLPLLVVMFVVYQWGHMLPLLYQIVHNPLQLLELPVFRIYVLGHAAAGDLARPYRQPSVFDVMPRTHPTAAPQARRAE
jgi:hypothetical protein